MGGTQRKRSAAFTASCLRAGVDFPDVEEKRFWRHGRFGPVVVSVTENETLILDYISDRYRVAYYAHANSALHGSPAKRAAFEHANLSRCLEIVIGETDSRSDPRTVEAYLRTTGWGKDLP